MSLIFCLARSSGMTESRIRHMFKNIMHLDLEMINWLSKELDLMFSYGCQLPYQPCAYYPGISKLGFEKFWIQIWYSIDW